MGAKDRLRRFLEQRRELGESELVLDRLSVDEVMAIVGAKSAAPTPTASAPSPPTERVAADNPPNDALSGPSAPVDPVPPPPEPGVRFDQGATTDWREALRNAGAVGPGEALPSRATSQLAPAGAANPRVGSVSASDTPHSRQESLTEFPTWLSALALPMGVEAGHRRVLDAAPDIARLATLEQIDEHVAGCARCALHKSAKHHVPGEGNAAAELLCVGEAPGAQEDEQGRPFVGESGELLTKILSAIQLSRNDVYICNVLKHRPPGNRDPLPDEIIACQPYLLRQIEIVRPRVILALGRFAAQTLLQSTSGIGDLRGRLHRFHGVPLIVTYHPAALLRNEAWKRPAWEDVKLVRRILDASRAARADISAP